MWLNRSLTVREAQIKTNICSSHSKKKEKKARCHQILSEKREILIVVIVKCYNWVSITLTKSFSYFSIFWQTQTVTGMKISCHGSEAQRLWRKQNVGTQRQHVSSKRWDAFNGQTVSSGFEKTHLSRGVCEAWCSDRVDIKKLFGLRGVGLHLRETTTATQTRVWVQDGG